jgi:hypothetical protein
MTRDLFIAITKYNGERNKIENIANHTKEIIYTRM